MKRTAHEIDEKFGTEHDNMDCFIDGQIQNTIVYTHDEVNKIIEQLEKQLEGYNQYHTDGIEQVKSRHPDLFKK